MARVFFNTKEINDEKARKVKSLLESGKTDSVEVYNFLEQLTDCFYKKSARVLGVVIDYADRSDRPLILVNAKSISGSRLDCEILIFIYNRLKDWQPDKDVSFATFLSSCIHQVSLETAQTDTSLDAMMGESDDKQMSMYDTIADYDDNSFSDFADSDSEKEKEFTEEFYREKIGKMVETFKKSRLDKKVITASIITSAVSEGVDKNQLMQWFEEYESQIDLDFVEKTYDYFSDFRIDDKNGSLEKDNQYKVVIRENDIAKYLKKAMPSVSRTLTTFTELVMKNGETNG